MFVETMPQTSKFDKNCKPTDLRGSKNPWMRNMKMTVPQYIIIELLKSGDKKNILKAAGIKKKMHYMEEQE